MIINKRNRDETLGFTGGLAKDRTGQENLRILFFLNGLMLEMNETLIKYFNPKISKRDILIELNKIYWNDNKYENRIKKFNKIKNANCKIKQK